MNVPCEEVGMVKVKKTIQNIYLLIRGSVFSISNLINNTGCSGKLVFSLFIEGIVSTINDQ